MVPNQKISYGMLQTKNGQLGIQYIAVMSADIFQSYMVNCQWSGPPRSSDIAEKAWRRWGLQPGPPNHMLVKVILKGLVRDNPMGNVSSL
jgi:hypothetical protein